MAKAEQQSSEQGVQGRFSYGRFRAVVSFMHNFIIISRGLQYIGIVAQKTNRQKTIDLGRQYTARGEGTPLMSKCAEL